DMDRVLGGSYESRTGMGIGLSGTRRLMDYFQIQSAPGVETRVTFGKALPSSVRPLALSEVGRICDPVAQERAPGALDELQRQNQELLQTLEALRQREQELENLNIEMSETNRGVVALYAELDEKAVGQKRADEMKSHFLLCDSHEFRTPVNSVLALTDLLLRRVDG